MVAKACASLGLNTWFTTAGTLRSIKDSFDARNLDLKVNQRAVYQAGLIDRSDFGHIDDWTAGVVRMTAADLVSWHAKVQSLPCTSAAEALMSLMVRQWKHGLLLAATSCFNLGSRG